MNGLVINIPTPEPKDFDIAQLGYNKNIVIGKAFQYAPEPVAAVVGAVLSPPTPLDIIKDFLRDMPDPQAPVEKPSLNIPAFENTMPVLSHGALASKPVYSNLEIDGQTWTDFSGATKGFESMVFNTVLVSIHQTKNIVETQIQGSDDGAVFEYCGLNNYDVLIETIITGTGNGIYPSDAVQEIIKMTECPNPIKVNSWYLQMANINEVVIVDYDVAQAPGSISQQVVTIQARSNKRATLIIKDNNAS